MSDHGTIAFPGWYIRFQQAALAALPRPPQLDQDTGLGWADDGETMARLFAEALLPRQKASPQPVLPTYPAEGEVFELTLDGDAPENHPIAMVRRAGYSQPERWSYAGEKLAGKQIRRFKLVSVGYCCDFPELARKLAKHGTIPPGQWREALTAAYRSGGNGPVGVADSSWVDPYGRACFPYIYTDGGSHFSWNDADFNDCWRWLVEVSK